MSVRNFQFDLEKYPVQTTGILEEVTEFWSREKRAKHPGEEPPRVYKDGLPLVSVECSRIVENYGRYSTEMFSVSMRETEAVMALAGVGCPVELVGVSVSGYVRDGGIVMSWSADGLVDAGALDLDSEEDDR